MSTIDIAKLSPAERLDLLEQLWDSLSDEAVPTTDAQRTELDRRLRDHEANPDDVLPWEAVKASISSRLKG
jgi:putative addiction module component (TIGR02574 family)